MKAFVRMSRVRARSCQETVSGLAAMLSSLLEAGRRAGADDLTRLAPNISESVWQLACKVVRLAWSEDPCRSADRELDATAHHHTALFATVDNHLITGAGPGSIPLMQDRELPPWPLSR